jgi:hypothetical protein
MASIWCAIIAKTRANQKSTNGRRARSVDSRTSIVVATWFEDRRGRRADHTWKRHVQESECSRGENARDDRMGVREDATDREHRLRYDVHAEQPRTEQPAGDLDEQAAAEAGDHQARVDARQM